MKNEINDFNETKFQKDASTVSRRKFFGKLGKAAVASAALGAAVPLLDATSSSVSAQSGSLLQPRSNARAQSAFQARVTAAQINLHSTPPNFARPSNGDESAFPNKIANYSKGLPH